MKRILFLISVPPGVIEKYLAIHAWSNEMLPVRLEELGASVTIKQWLDEDIIESLFNHDVVNFFWAEDYIRHPSEFAQFLGGGHCPLIVNKITLVRWNMHKGYLLDMQRAGFDIPARSFPLNASSPVVVKPSISASSTNTHLIPDIASLSTDDLAYLDSCTKGLFKSSLIIQKFEPEITMGEYSFIVINERLSHFVLKRRRDGEFQCQSKFGGRLRQVTIEDIEPLMLFTAKSIFNMLKGLFGNESTGRIGYLAIDGLVTEDRPFVLMEIEAIEPELSLEFGGSDELLSLLIGN
ncbi:hypothetical protein BJY01DRAFT_238890 [Aspergillus pseudoustus]|uniref:Prokaryotic glutathione synthetase ATP-binding domain-containing protein n=1 Tax=Aspergillus pseudoustus TaxID=1810923 RepID=A0ABR4J5R5_9EURO